MHTSDSTTSAKTRTPAFWGYPLLPHEYPYYWVILDPESKEDKVKIVKVKEFVKISNFSILKQTLHATHPLKLLDKMCTYEMDLTSIVEVTEQTLFCPQTDGGTDGRTDGRMTWNQYTPSFNFVEAEGIIKTSGVISIWRFRLTCKGNPMITIRQYHSHVIYTMGIPIHGKTFFILWLGPAFLESVLTNSRVWWGIYINHARYYTQHSNDNKNHVWFNCFI